MAKLVYDVELGKPACPILQAVLGGDEHVTNGFSADSWLVVPTPGMKLYLVSDAQLRELQRRANASR